MNMNASMAVFSTSFCEAASMAKRAVKQEWFSPDKNTTLYLATKQFVMKA